jgi:hypothetical protein
MRRLHGESSFSRPMVGAALVEFVIVVPILLVLLFGVFEFGRVLQYNTIIVNMGREGGNLAARTFIDDYQEIMDKLALTADPLDMSANGMIYITQVEGLDDGSGKVIGHYRWLGGGYAVSSNVWTCTSWEADGSCDLPDPAIADIPMTLDKGEIVYAVEVFYNYHMVFTDYLQIGPDIGLSSMTVL